MTAPSKSGVCSRSLAVTVVSNPAGWGHGCLSFVSATVSQVEVPATRRSLVQRSPTGCDVSKCVLETSTIRRSWSTGTVELWEGKMFLDYERVMPIMRFVNDDNVLANNEGDEYCCC